MSDHLSGIAATYEVGTVTIRSGMNRRGGGITTLLLDSALMNAKAGARVEFWSNTFQQSERAMRKAIDRLQICDMEEEGSRYASPGGIPTITFPKSGGRLEFHSSSRPTVGGITQSQPDFYIADMDVMGQITRYDWHRKGKR